jgi:transcription antitermination factor NusB
VKNKFDPRHKKRIKNMQAIFAWQCGNPSARDISFITDNIGKIDEHITLHAPKWPLDKINKIDLAILRNAVWELTFQPQTPHKVIIDEAIEIAKEYGNDSSSSFVNGVLGSILKELEDQHGPTKTA